MKHIGLFLLFLFLCPLAYGNIHSDNLDISARQVNVLSVHDTSYDKLTNESKGLFSSYKQVDERRASRAITSHLKAKHVNVSAGNKGTEGLPESPKI